MEDQIHPKNFDRICRLCLEYASHENVLFPLFINDANIPGYYGRFIKEFKESIPEVLSTCTGIEIDPSERLPLNICSVCEKQLIKTNEFRRKCWQSNEYLRELRLTDEAVDFDTDGDALKHTELVIVDHLKEESEEEDEEMDSSCDSVWDNLGVHTNVADLSINDKFSIKTESATKKTAIKRSTTIPLVTPSTPIVPVNCNEAVDRKKTEDQLKESKKLHYRKKPKMCTVCGVMVDRLRDHMRTHPDKLEYSCKLCPKRYLSTRGLSKHIRHQHTEDSSFENKINSDDGGQGQDADTGCNKNLWQCNLRKRFRQMGETYIGVDGTFKPGRSVKRACPVSCYLRCQFNVDGAQRLLIHKSFWKLTDDEKYNFYAKNVQRISSLRKRTKAEPSRRMFSFIYFFDIYENGEVLKRMQVCQRFFIYTLDISKGRVYYYFQKIHDSKKT